MRLFTLLAVLALMAGCASRRCSPVAPMHAVPRAGSWSEDDEARYHEALASPWVLALQWLVHNDDEVPLVRGAAARALCDLGETEASWRLIANLHRDQRTYVTVDAIHHLEAVFGHTFDYDANLGYRHQTEKLDAWVAWYADRFPASPAIATLRALAAQGDTAEVPTPTPLERLVAGTTEKGAFMDAWRWLAERAKSRDPVVVASVEVGFGELLKRRPDEPLLMNNYALAALNNGHWEAAEQQYRRALARMPKDPQVHNDIGILLEGLGRLPEAEQAYRRAHELRPDDDVALANLGDVLRKQGRGEEARAAYAQAEERAPDKWHYHRLWSARIPRAR